MTLQPDQSDSRLRAAAQGVSEAWDRWMTDEEGEGQEAMEAAIATLRGALSAAPDEGSGPHG